MKFSIIFTQIRGIRHKPWVPKFRLMRRYQPFIQPFDKERLFAFKFQTLDPPSPIYLKNLLLKNGIMPPFAFQDKAINIGHSSKIFDPFKPRESDGKSSSLISFARDTALEQADSLLKKGKSYNAARKIRKYEPTFDADSFTNGADIYYRKAHELLTNFCKNKEVLLEFVTEKALVSMSQGLENKTFEWKFLQSLEPPRTVQIRCEEMVAKNNWYGQVTVRFHTQQAIAIYDRFGRLIFGHPDIPVDMLEYIVFEKHLTDEYGRWRIHDKIKP